MRPDILFNCCPQGVEPDWQAFTNLEIGGCVNAAEEGTDETCVVGGKLRDEAEFFTIYGRLRQGGCEAITDCPDFGSALSVAMRLCARSCLTLAVVC